MKKAQVALRVDQLAGLKNVADMTGRSESELIRSAVDIVLAQNIANTVNDRQPKGAPGDMPNPVIEIREAFAELKVRAGGLAANEV